MAIKITLPDIHASLDLPHGVVRNPYPAWQDTGANCWNCYRLLWSKQDCDLHLCPNCQAAGITTCEE